MRKRWNVLVIAGAVLFTALAGRLAYIQLAGHEDLSAAAYAQQQIILEGADTRGTIYDRNGNPLAGQQQEYIYIIEADDFDGETMNALNEVEAEEIKGQKGQYRVFASEDYSKETAERLIRNSDAYIIEAGRRYSDNQPAVHMIGYVNKDDSSGASGIELMYDEELSAFEKTVSASADVKGTLLRGTGLTVSSAADEDEFIKDGVVTTLDLSLQKKVEEILADCSKTGAVTVTDCDTGEILAAASTPVFEPMNVEQYMDSDDGELINKVTQGEYPPGSVFKIIVAAAALEAGIDPDKVYSCSGSENVGERSVGCSTGGEAGHGSITFEDAFADSCNCAFIQIACETGTADILEMAERMGLGNTVLDGYPGEKSGNLVTEEESQGAALANVALGQGEILVTPLQIARLTGIIANGGVDPGVHLVINETGIMEAERILSEETAGDIQDMMRKTMTAGTGRNLSGSDGADSGDTGSGKENEVHVTMAAKTGSAQSVQGGIEVVHGWITGYVPAEDPEYVITVFVEDGRSGSGSAGPLFAAVSRWLSESGMIQYEMGV